MKIRIETDNDTNEPEIIIRCREIDSDVVKVQTAIMDALKHGSKLALTRNGKEYYLSPEQVLFFEAVDGKTFAHTASDVFDVKYKLYELEEILPSSFTRASKSVIIGTRFILAITRNLTGPSLVQFRGSHKQVNVSRSYYKQLVDKLSERSSR